MPTRITSTTTRMLMAVEVGYDFGGAVGNGPLMLNSDEGTAAAHGRKKAGLSRRDAHTIFGVE